MTTFNSSELKAVADAINLARYPNHEGPYGLFDYSEYPGDGPAHVVRDFRRELPRDKYGFRVFASDDEDVAHAEYERLTNEYVATAAVEAVLHILSVRGKI